MLRDLLGGLRAYAAVVPLFTRLGLWRYLLLTAAISVGVACAIVAACLALIPLIGLDDAGGWLAWLAAVVALSAGGLVFFKHIVLVLASPWMGMVAARVEGHFRKTRGLAPAPYADQTGATLFARSLRLNVRLLFGELLWSLPLFAVAFVPVLNVAATVALFVVQAYFAGAALLDYSMERRLGYRAALGYLRAQRGLATGVGAGFVALLLTGVGFLVAPAWSAAAGAWAYAEREARREAERGG